MRKTGKRNLQIVLIISTAIFLMHSFSTPALSEEKSQIQEIPKYEGTPPDSLIVTDYSASYDENSLYVDFTTKADISSGTIDPPIINFYGIGINNISEKEESAFPPQYLWAYTPLVIGVQSKAFHEMIALFETDPCERMTPETCNQYKKFIECLDKTGMIVLNLKKLSGGNIFEYFLLDAGPVAIITGNHFSGRINIESLGDVQPENLRIRMITGVNPSIDSFNPRLVDLTDPIAPERNIK